MNNAAKEDGLTLEVLRAVEAEQDVTQRQLAKDLGIALGLANSYLKRCVRKGWIKIQQAPANRYLYYLTPTGFAEKSRLTAEYLSDSFMLYRKAGESYRRLLSHCRQQGWNEVVLCGVSELAEIAALRAMETGITITGLYDPDYHGTRLLNFPVRQTTQDFDARGVWLITTLDDPLSLYRKLAEELPQACVLLPDLFGIDTVDTSAVRSRAGAGSARVSLTEKA